MSRNVKTYKSFLNEDLLKGGAADNMKESDFDPNELALGIKEEMEHTTDPKLAKEIAMDHLAKDPNYYSKHTNEDVRHEGDMWNVYDLGGKKLVGSYATRDEARKHDDILKKSKRR